MRGVLVVLVVVAAAGVGILLLTRAGSKGSAQVKDRSGDLMRMVRTLVDTMPRPGSNAYHDPTVEQKQQMTTAYGAIENGNLDQAASTADPLGYDVIRYRDTGTGRSLVMLQERRRANGSWAHAWGTFIFSPSSTSHLLVEAPHALDDIDSWIVAVDTFRKANAAALFLSGASRYANDDGSSDMAHNPGSIFQAINKTALARREAIVFEPHGFDTQEHVDYGDVVVSNGTSNPDKVTRAVANGLRAAGLSVCVYDGEHCSGLGGTTNVQGQSITPGDTFLHVEMALIVRRSPVTAAEVAEAVARATASSPSG